GVDDHHRRRWRLREPRGMEGALPTSLRDAPRRPPVRALWGRDRDARGPALVLSMGVSRRGPRFRPPRHRLPDPKWILPTFARDLPARRVPLSLWIRHARRVYRAYFLASER